jgi:FtsP/CotA-like multicopper oxidase with cupredoxin domain
MRDTTPTPTPTSTAETPEAVSGLETALPRRTFLKGAALAAGGAVAATAAVYAPALGASKWSASPLLTPGVSNAGMTHGQTAAGGSPVPGGEPIPAGWTEHDMAARERVRRFVGNLAGPLGLAPFIGEPTDDPEFTKVPHGNVPLEYTMDGDVKVFDLTVDEMEWQIDALMNPVKALGYNKMWPGPLLRVVQGDRVRVNFTNNLKETTGVHFHGVEFDDFTQDGVPFVTQLPIVPGETFAYEFVAPNAGSHMYHSHHNATDQVGRGLLGAFIVEPKDEAERPSKKYNLKPEHDVVFIHNDMLGGFTINGHGFPATMPIVANVGDTVYIRYMNEGVMMHPWHTHGFRQRVVARDGWPLGSAEFDCDTLGVNPGERWDTVVVCDRPGVWAFHCHILPHVEGLDGMFGMVTALVILPKA